MSRYQWAWRIGVVVIAVMVLAAMSPSSRLVALILILLVGVPLYLVDLPLLIFLAVAIAAGLMLAVVDVVINPRSLLDREDHLVRHFIIGGGAIGGAILIVWLSWDFMSGVSRL